MADGFIWGGFEGASHRRFDGQRVDSIHASGHDRWAMLDHAILRSLGIRCARESFRWHLIEIRPGEYDFSSALQQVRAARAAGVKVVWGLCHWGVPDHIDVMGPCFPRKLADFARAALRMLREEVSDIGGWVPINEMAFWSWAGGHKGGFSPYLSDRGDDLKNQLVHGHLAVAKALREEGNFHPIIVCEPLIWIHPEEGGEEEAYLIRLKMEGAFAAVEAILLADPTAIDVLGLNYYRHNQWTVPGRQINPGEPGHRPLRYLLNDAAKRLALPIAITETGAEEPFGTDWLEHITEEVAAALAMGVDLRGICIYPIMDYPGWDNGRHCPCGPIGHRNGQRYVRAAQHQAVLKLDALRCRVFA